MTVPLRGGEVKGPAIKEKYIFKLFLSSDGIGAITIYEYYIQTNRA